MAGGGGGGSFFKGTPETIQWRRGGPVAQSIRDKAANQGSKTVLLITNRTKTACTNIFIKKTELTYLN